MSPSERLNDRRDALPAANARSRQAALAAAAPQFEQHRQEQPRAGHPQRVAECDRAAVDDPTCVAGGNGALLLERGRQRRERVERRVWPRVAVLVDDLDTLARFDLDRHDLLDEPALVRRLRGKLLAAEREAILLLARDAVFGGAVLSGHRHRAAAVRIEERFPQGVLELPLSELEAGAQTA